MIGGAEDGGADTTTPTVVPNCGRRLRRLTREYAARTPRMPNSHAEDPNYHLWIPCTDDTDRKRLGKEKMMHQTEPTPITDLVVVVPGIMGTTLRRGKQMVWAPSAGAAVGAVKTFGANVKALQLPKNIGDNNPGDGVEPVAPMPDLHVLPGLWTPVKGYDKLLDRLSRLGYKISSGKPSAPPGNLIVFPYDWRLSNRYNGAQLKEFVEPRLDQWRSQGGPYAEGRLVFVCHSMGGLVARWYIEKCEGGAELTRKLITLGTPYRGSAKALDQLVNGVRKGLGRLSVDLTEFARSMPSLHQLIPEYACIDHGGSLSKTTETVVPELDTEMVKDAMCFHTQLRKSEIERPESAAMTHPIVGINQPTSTTLRLEHGRAISLNNYGADDLSGDATVPLVGAIPDGTALDANTVRRVADKHGNLQRNAAALDELEGILTGRQIRVRGGPMVQPRVEVPELAFQGELVRVQISFTDGGNHGVKVTVTNEAGKEIDFRAPKPTNGTAVATFTDLPPGAYSIDVTGVAGTSEVGHVSSDVLVWDAPCD